jgi:ArsR family transcriptional regulator, arsenate/arsenite/antimonite-responsive transcriptional repressor
MLMSPSTAELTVDAPEGAGTTSDLAEAAVKLFGDPLRARLVHLLSQEQLCTCHLVEETGARQSTISHHLRILREAGFVATESCGRFTYYRLRPEALTGLIVGMANLTAQAHSAQSARRPCD